VRTSAPTGPRGGHGRCTRPAVCPSPRGFSHREPGSVPRPAVSARAGPSAPRQRGGHPRAVPGPAAQRRRAVHRGNAGGPRDRRRRAPLHAHLLYGHHGNRYPDRPVPVVRADRPRGRSDPRRALLGRCGPRTITSAWPPARIRSFWWWGGRSQDRPGERRAGGAGAAGTIRARAVPRRGHRAPVVGRTAGAGRRAAPTSGDCERPGT
jgi:hypothetical protein